MNSQPVGTGNIDSMLFNMHFFKCVLFLETLLFKHLLLFLIDKIAARTVPNGVYMGQTKTLSLLQGLHLCQDAWAPKSPWDSHGAHAALWGRPSGVGAFTSLFAMRA